MGKGAQGEAVAEALAPSTAAMQSSETARLSALERLRRAAADAEGRNIVPTGRTTPSLSTETGGKTPGQAAQSNVLERLRAELAKAEGSILANGSRIAGQPTPPPVAAARPSSTEPAPRARRGSPARATSPQPDSAAPGPAGEGAEGQSGEPAGEPATSMGAPLSAVEKLRKALQETHDKLDDKKGLHWLASHSPEWPQSKFPKLHVEPSGGLRAKLHLLQQKIKEESDAVASLRRAAEDAGKHHAHLSAQLGFHVNHATPMWSEVGARFLNRFKDAPALKPQLIAHDFDLELPPPREGRRGLARGRAISVIKEKPVPPPPPVRSKSAARLSLSFTSPARNTWEVSFGLGASGSRAQEKYGNDAECEIATGKVFTKRFVKTPRVEPVLPPPVDIVLEAFDKGAVPMDDDPRVVPPPLPRIFDCAPVLGDDLVELPDKSDVASQSDARDAFKTPDMAVPRSATAEEAAPPALLEDALLPDAPNKPQKEPRLLKRKLKGSQGPMTATVVPELQPKAVRSAARRKLKAGGAPLEAMLLPPEKCPGARKGGGKKRRSPTDTTGETLFLEKHDCAADTDDALRPERLVAAPEDRRELEVPAPPATLASCDGPPAQSAPKMEALLEGRDMLFCGVKPEARYEALEEPLAAPQKAARKIKLRLNLGHKKEEVTKAHMRLETIKLTRWEACCIIQAHVRGLEARRLMQVMKAHVLLNTSLITGERAKLGAEDVMAPTALRHVLVLAEAYRKGTEGERHTHAKEAAMKATFTRESHSTKGSRAKSAKEMAAEAAKPPNMLMKIFEEQGEAAALEAAAKEALRWTNWMVPAPVRSAEADANAVAAAAVGDMLREGDRDAGKIAARIAAKVAAEIAADAMISVTEMGLNHVEYHAGATIANSQRQGGPLGEAPGLMPAKPAEPVRKRLEGEFSRLRSQSPPAPRPAAKAAPPPPAPPPEAPKPSSPSPKEAGRWNRVSSVFAKKKGLTEEEAALRLQKAYKGLRARRYLQILKARVDLRTAVARVRERGREAQPDVLEKTMVLGDAYLRSWNLVRAEQCYTHVMDNMEREYGRGDARCVRPASALARVYRLRGDTMHAEEIMRRALETPPASTAADPVSNVWNSLAGAFSPAAPTGKNSQPVKNAAGKGAPDLATNTAAAAKAMGDAVAQPFNAAADSIKQLNEQLAGAANDLWSMGWLGGNAATASASSSVQQSSATATAGA